jgi:hypothetical protein
MKLTDEIKMIFRKLLIPFYDSEIKEGYAAISDVENLLKNDIEALIYWPEIAKSIERILVIKPKKFISTLEKNKFTPRKLVYIMCYNIAQEEIDAIDNYQISKRHGLTIIINVLKVEIEKLDS